MMHPARLINQAAELLAQAGCASPVPEARILLHHITNTDAVGLLRLTEVSHNDQERFWELIHQRAQGVPVQYLTKESFFRHVRLNVGPGVFIPRPETEIVAGAAIDRASRCDRPVVVELCAGSGAISKAIVDEVRGAMVIAVEKSEQACVYLRANLAHTCATVVCADMDGSLTDMNNSVDVLVCNPPYVPLSDRDGLPDDVRGHDPAMALYGGPDGLELYPVLARTALRLLKPGGALVAEHGDDQGPQVCSIFEEYGFVEIESHEDLTRRPRYVTANSPVEEASRHG